jgi:hypothetical protein
MKLWSRATLVLRPYIVTAARTFIHIIPNLQEKQGRMAYMELFERITEEFRNGRGIYDKI